MDIYLTFGVERKVPMELEPEPQKNLETIARLQPEILGYIIISHEEPDAYEAAPRDLAKRLGLINAYFYLEVIPYEGNMSQFLAEADRVAREMGLDYADDNAEFMRFYISLVSVDKFKRFRTGLGLNRHLNN